MKLAVALFSMLCLASVGCGEDEAKAYSTYQACFDDKAKEMLPIQESIVKCCLEHPIGGTTIVCGDAKPDCINYLTANLSQTSASTIDVMDACGEYVSQKSMMK
ncbi:MAG: hypothetical protein JNL83_40445 [Myxococcales bacterium]|nr:hypothetical protein [Myxococcales bacterium]